MILFDRDVQKFDIHIHTETTNLSFVRMAILLRKMGVKNHLFFLSLVQPELIGVDPHDPRLSLNTPEMKDLRARIMLECKINPWYLFREVLKVPKSGTDGGSFELNRAFLAMIWLFFNNQDLFLTIPRQIGKSVSAICIMAWLVYIAGVRVNVGLFAKDNGLIQEDVSRLKVIRDLLPGWMVHKQAVDTDNKEGLDYKALGNQFITFCAQKDLIAAAKQGRGDSLISQLWDEFAYYVNNHLSYKSALSSIRRARPQARAAGIPCANIIITTAGNRATAEGAFAYQVKSACMPFHEKLYDCTDVIELRDILMKNSCSMDNSKNPICIFYLEYSYHQLGLDDAWFLEVTRGLSQMEIDLDYLNKWMDTSSQSILTAKMVTELDEGKIEPIKCTVFEGLLINWYVDPDKILRDDRYRLRKFVIGGDTSDNIGRDFTTIVVTDPTDLSVVATCRCNLANLMNVARLMVYFLKTLPASILIPERNKNGAFLIDTILDMMRLEAWNPLQRIFNTIYQDYDKAPTDLQSVDVNLGTFRDKFGFKTTSSTDSRDMLYKRVLSTAMDLAAKLVRDPTLVQELKSLTIRNGRIDHPTGGHDDMVIAYLLTAFFILQGRNLSKYGIARGEFLSLVSNAVQADEAEGKRDAQIKLRERIKSLEARLMNQSAPSLEMAYRRELDLLKLQVEDISLDGVVSADQLDATISTVAPREVKYGDDIKYRLRGFF